MSPAGGEAPVGLAAPVSSAGIGPGIASSGRLGSVAPGISVAARSIVGPCFAPLRLLPEGLLLFSSIHVLVGPCSIRLYHELAGELIAYTELTVVRTDSRENSGRESSRPARR